MWYLLFAYFIRLKGLNPGGNKGAGVVVAIYLLSTLLICDHYSLIMMGIVEIFDPSTAFYNVFCTVLYVIDPILIFLSTMALIYLFYTQTKRRREQIKL
jgi:hypothetical protein